MKKVRLLVGLFILISSVLNEMNASPKATVPMPLKSQMKTSVALGTYNVASPVTSESSVNGRPAWYLYYSGDNANADSLTLLQIFASVLEKAKTTYANSFVYNKQYDQNSPLITDVSQISSNAKEPNEGSYEALIDNNVNTYFHSIWSGEGPSTQHNLQIDLSRNPVQQFIFKTTRRIQNNNNRPTSITIAASNDNTEDSSWTTIQTISSGLPIASDVNDYQSPAIDMGRTYKYVRFSVNSTNNNLTNSYSPYPFFSYSEFQMYPLIFNSIDSIHSPSIYLGQVVVDLGSAIETAKLVTTPTQSDIDALQTALNDYNQAYIDYNTGSVDAITFSAYIDSISNLNLSFPQGKDPGFYDAEKVDAFNTAFAAAQVGATEEHTSREYQAFIDRVNSALNAVKTSIKPIEEGKYYLVSAYTNFMNMQSVTKAMYVNNNNLGWTTLDTINTNFVFILKKLENGNFSIQNAGTMRYINESGGENSTSYPVSTSEAQTTAQKIISLGQGQWKICNETNSIGYHTGNHDSGSGITGSIVTWNTPVNGPSAWYLRHITNDVNIDSLLLLQNFVSVLEKAKTAYANSFVYNKQYDQNSPLITDVNQISSNAKEPNEGSYEALIDGDIYSYFHSIWSGVGPSTQHNLQIDISRNPVQRFIFKTTRRMQNNNDRPTSITVAATNDTTRGSSWTTIQTITTGLPVKNEINNYESSVIDMGQTFKYVRFSVNSTNYNSTNGYSQYPFFSYSEFQMYSLISYSIDSIHSPGIYLGQVVVDLGSAIESAKLVTTPTQSDIDALQTAINNLNQAYTASMINVAGSLSSKITDYSIDSLTVSGAVNVNDLNFIRNNLTKLVYLNLKDASYEGSTSWPSSLSGSSTLREIYLPYNIVDFEYNGLSNCTALTKIVLPSNMTAIGGANSFRGCTSLTSLDLPANLTFIGYGSFGQCSSLKKLYVKATTPPTLDGAFSEYDGSGLLVYVPKGSANVYRSNNNWNSFTIIDGEEITVNVQLAMAGTLADRMLEQATSLASVNHLTISGPINDADQSIIRDQLPNLLTINMKKAVTKSLIRSIFQYRPCLQSVILPDSLTSIGENAFYYATSLESISLPESLTTIGSQAFYNCNSLKSIVIPDNVTRIEGYTFQENHSLKSVVLPKKLNYIGSYAFYNNYSLRSISFPEDLKRIESGAFNYVPLDTIVLPKGLEYLGGQVFRSTIKELSIPGSMKYCDYAFSDCPNLKTVYCYAAIPPYSQNFFGDNNRYANCKLYVPSISINTYRKNSAWNRFAAIEPMPFDQKELFVYSELTVPETARPVNRPNLTVGLLYNDQLYRIQIGRMTTSGDSTFSLGIFKQHHNIYGIYNYDGTELGQYYGGARSALLVESPMRADSVVITPVVNSEGWHFVSFPFDVKVSDIKIYPETTLWVIRKYSGKNRAAQTGNNWQNMTADSILHAGEGYILSISSNASMSIPAINNAQKNLIFARTNRTLPLSQYPSEFAHNSNWNFIGNPYPCYFDTRYMNFTAPITVWNGYGYTAYSPIDDEYILRPMEAFFVQCPANTSGIEFTTKGRQLTHDIIARAAGSKAVSSDGSRQIINLTMTNGTTIDRTRVVLNDKANTGYEMERDASKFMSSVASAPQIFTVEQGIRFAINERPLGSKQTQLGVYAGQAGQYTIALAEDVNTKVTLVDMKENRKVELNSTGYTFQMEAGTNTNRFILLFDNTPNNINGAIADQVRVDAVNGGITVKAPEGSQIIVFDAAGKELIQSTETNVRLSLPVNVYVVKVNGISYKVSVVK